MKCYLLSILIYTLLLLINTQDTNDTKETNLINELILRKDNFNPNLLTLEIDLGKRKVQMPIDISSDLTWVINSSQDDSLISTPTLFNIQCLVTGETKETSLSISNIIYVNPISYIDVTSSISYSHSHCQYRSTLGLAKTFDDDSFSLVHKLKKTNMSRYFGIRMNSILAEGVFILSKLNPFPLSIDGQKTIEFKAIDIGKKWGGRIDGVIIGDLITDIQPNTNINAPEGKMNQVTYDYKISRINYFPLSTNFSFETMHRFITVSHELFDFIGNKLFKGKQCENRVKDFLSVYYCDQKVLFELKEEIHFIIQSYVFTFTLDDLFTNKESNEVMFLIVCYLRQPSMISIGHVFLSRYTLFFDTEDLKITITSKNEDIMKLRLVDQKEYDRDYNDYNVPNIKHIVKRVDKAFIIAFMCSFIGIFLLLISLVRQKEMPTSIIIK